MGELLEKDTILWTMQGTRQNDNIHWKAVPKIIESVEKYMYRFYTGGGISHNGVGSLFFTSKEECEQHWLTSHDSFEELIGFEDPTPAGIDERPRTNWETYEVNRFDGVYSTAIYYGGLDRLENITANITWNKDVEHVGMYGMTVEYLTLHEISDQLKSEGLLTVIVNGPMRSMIFQYGNYPDQGWVYLGEVQGYA